MARKTYIEKLNTSHDLPKIEDAPEIWGGGTMLIPSPLMVYEAMQLIPKGQVISKNGIRKFLAKENGTSISCPLTTGIFCNISAFAAEEKKASGLPDKTPWWRVTKDKGELNEKFPGGINLQKELLEKEGIEIIPKRNKLFVKDFEQLAIEL